MHTVIERRRRKKKGFMNDRDITPKNKARVTMVCGLGTIDVIILEVSDFNKAILDRWWVVALDLCGRKTIQIHHQSPCLLLVILCVYCVCIVNMCSIESATHRLARVTKSKKSSCYWDPPMCWVKIRVSNFM